MASKKVSPTLKVLVEIRDELRSTGERLDHRIDSLDHRIDSLDHRVGSIERELHDSSVRVSTELIAVSSVLTDVRDLLRARLDDRDRLDDHERRLLELEQKVG